MGCIDVSVVTAMNCVRIRGHLLSGHHAWWPSCGSTVMYAIADGRDHARVEDSSDGHNATAYLHAAVRRISQGVKMHFSQALSLRKVTMLSKYNSMI